MWFNTLPIGKFSSKRKVSSNKCDSTHCHGKLSSERKVSSNVIGAHCKGKFSSNEMKFSGIPAVAAADAPHLIQLGSEIHNFLSNQIEKGSIWPHAESCLVLAAGALTNEISALWQEANAIHRMPKSAWIWCLWDPSKWNSQLRRKHSWSDAEFCHLQSGESSIAALFLEIRKQGTLFW